MFKASSAHDKHAVQLYCVCQRPSLGFMVECDHCNEWYHGDCVDIKEEEVHDDTEFVCVMCSETKKSELVYSLRSLRVKCSKPQLGHSNDWADPQVPAFLQPSYCICSGRDDGRAMLLCAICQEWYHAPCVGMENFVDVLLPHKRSNPELYHLYDKLSTAHAFVCSRCSDEDHQIMDEEQYLSIHEKTPRRIECKEKLHAKPTRKSHKNKSPILASLRNREILGMQHKQSGKMHNTLCGAQWMKLQTLKLLDIAAWSNIAPWVVRTCPAYPAVAVGTNIGTIELFSTSLSGDESPPPDHVNPLAQSALQGLATDVAHQHIGAVTTEFLDDISALEWSADASLIAASTWLSGQTVLCDVQRGQPVKSFAPHKELIRSLHMPRDNQHMLVSASHDKTVCLSDIRGPEQIVLDGHAGRVVGAQTVWPYVLSASSDSTIRVWDVRNHSKCVSITTVPSPITSLDISADSTRVCVNTVPGSVLLFDTTDILYSCQSESALAHYWELLGHVNKFWCVGRAYFSPDGTAIATGSEDCCTVVWNVASNTPRPGVAYRSKTNTHWVWDVAWVHQNNESSALSPTLITCSEDRTIAMLGTESLLNDAQISHNAQQHSKLSIGTHVLARWHDSRYYHAVTDGEIGGMYHVTFRGWHGPDSRALYEPGSLLHDTTLCSCKRGHFAADIPPSCVSLMSPHSPPPLVHSPSSSSSPDTPARKRPRRTNSNIITLTHTPLSPLVARSALTLSSPLPTTSPSLLFSPPMTSISTPSTPSLSMPSTPSSTTSTPSLLTPSTPSSSSSVSPSPLLPNMPPSSPPHFSNTARRLDFMDTD